MSDEEKLYSTKQAAKFLGVSVRTIKRYRRDGILKPDSFGSNHTALYTEEQLVKGVTRLLEGGDTFLQKQPQVVTRYQQVVTRYTQSPEKNMTSPERIGITSATSCDISATNCDISATSCDISATSCDISATSCDISATSCNIFDSQNGTPTAKAHKKNMTKSETIAIEMVPKKVGNRLPVPQPLVQRLLNGGTKTVVSKTNNKKESSVEVEVEVELEDIEEYYFDDDDDDITIIDDNFKATLPPEYRQNLTKLFGKLTVAPMGEVFSTPFNNTQTLITYAKLDYANSGVTFNGKFNKMHELILNSLYSFYRAENIFFTSRNILQHIFGNVPDHFQEGLVKIIDQHLDELRCMRISMDLKDKFGNNAHIKIHGEKYRPIEIEESLLDVSILKMKSAKNSKIVKVYRINRLSPIFKYAEKLKQITSWNTIFMKVPVRKTMQNALICNYLLTKISLIKNSKNKYKNNGILFTSIHEDLKLDVDNRNKVKNIRDNIRKMFDYWVQIGLIKSYLFEKKGKSFYKISFTIASDELKGSE